MRPLPNRVPNLKLVTPEPRKRISNFVAEVSESPSPVQHFVRMKKSLWTNSSSPYFYFLPTGRIEPETSNRQWPTDPRLIRHRVKAGVEPKLIRSKGELGSWWHLKHKVYPIQCAVPLGSLRIGELHRRAEDQVMHLERWPSHAGDLRLPDYYVTRSPGHRNTRVTSTLRNHLKRST
jgi:hypothetical protein